MACAATFTVKADFGIAMVVAPAYILHLKVSELIPWFSFGVAEYFFQGVLVLITIIVMRRFKLSCLFSLVTAVIYGTLLDIAMNVIASLPRYPLCHKSSVICVRYCALLICAFAVLPYIYLVRSAG